MRDGRRTWTTKEIMVLKAKYGNAGPDIVELLKHHSRQSIRTKASSLNLKVSKIIHYLKIARSNTKAGIIKECPECLKEFRVKASYRSAKYCSMECRNSGYRTGKYQSVICQNCGNEFKILESKFRLSGARFCCKLCQIEYFRGAQHPRWTGYDFRHSWAWHKLRKQVLIRDQNKCYLCGDEVDLNVHHIIPWTVKKLNFNWNLITLCRSCHQKVEAEHRRTEDLSNLQIQLLTRSGEMQYIGGTTISL